MAYLINLFNFNKELSITNDSPSLKLSKVEKITWIREVGEFIKNGDIICTIETSTTVMELESFHEGILLYRNSNKQISYNDIIAVIGNQGEKYHNSIKEYELTLTKQKKEIFEIENVYDPYYLESNDNYFHKGSINFFETIKRFFGIKNSN